MKISENREVFRIFLGLLPPRPSPDEKRHENGWKTHVYEKTTLLKNLWLLWENC